MTKDKLKSYRALGLEIAQLEEELAELLGASGIHRPVLDGMPKAKRLHDSTARVAVESVMLYSRLNAKRLEAVRLRGEIEDFIEGLAPVERALVRERYVMGKRWEDICGILEYSRSQMHHIHSKILKSQDTIGHPPVV